MTLYRARIPPFKRVGAIPHEGYLYISATNPPSKDALDKGLSRFQKCNKKGGNSQPFRSYSRLTGV